MNTRFKKILMFMMIFLAVFIKISSLNIKVTEAKEEVTKISEEAFINRII